MANMAEIAEQIVAARKRGDTKATLNGIVFALTERGMCSKFVRQCYESAVRGHDHQFDLLFGGTARETERKLQAANKAYLGPMVRGDVVCFNNQASTAGHIGICLGDCVIAENTISGTRGDPRSPGTKATPMESIGEHRISGVYRLIVNPSYTYADGPVQVAWLQERTWEGRLWEGKTYVLLQDVCRVTGTVARDRIPQERTVHVTET